MEAELKALEDRLSQLVRLCHRLRAENGQLRQQLAAAQNENKVLAEKINAAKSRLETLLQQIPEGAE
jgi:cell division protein ZapB